MSGDKQALDACAEDLWRIAGVLRDNPDASEPVGDLRQFEEALQALVGIVAARRRRQQIRLRLARPRPARAREIAASIDLDRSDKRCHPEEDPLSTDPVDWARAFLKSRAWLDEFKTYCWFQNAMYAANPDVATAEDPFWDDVPMYPHGRPPYTMKDSTDD